MIEAAIDSVQLAHPGLKARRREDGGYTLCMAEKVVARVLPVLGNYIVESSGGISHAIRDDRATPSALAAVLLHCIEDGVRELAA